MDFCNLMSRNLSISWCYIMQKYFWRMFDSLNLWFSTVFRAKTSFSTPDFRWNLVLLIFVHDNRIFATLWVEFWQYHDAIFWKNIFIGYFMHKIFDFLPFSMLKLHFQNLISAKIEYNEFLSLIIGFLQPYE